MNNVKLGVCATCLQLQCIAVIIVLHLYSIYLCISLPILSTAKNRCLVSIKYFTFLLQIVFFLQNLM